MEKGSPGYSLLLLFSVLLIVIFGMFLPVFTGDLYPPEGLINVFWGTLFGFGFWLEHAFLGMPPTGILGLAWALIGFVAWPTIVVTLFIKLENYIQKNHHSKGLVILNGLLFATLFFCWPIEDMQRVNLDGLPIFTKYLN